MIAARKHLVPVNAAYPTAVPPLGYRTQYTVVGPASGHYQWAGGCPVSAFVCPTLSAPIVAFSAHPAGRPREPRLGSAPRSPPALRCAWRLWCPIALGFRHSPATPGRLNNSAAGLAETRCLGPRRASHSLGLASLALSAYTRRRLPKCYPTGAAMPAVNPEILVWARTTAGLTLQDAVAKVGIRAAGGVAAVDRLTALERGVESPTRPVLVKMAHHYRRPLLAFYLSAPPRRDERGPDFRTLPGARSPETDALIDALVRDLQSRQNIVRIRLAPQPQCTRAAPRLGGRWVRRYGWPPRFCDGAPQPADKELRQVASCTEPVVAGRWQGEPERRSASAESRRGRRVSRAAGAGRVLPGRRASASTASLRSGPAGRARAGGRCARRWPAPAACRRPCACDCRRRPCV